MEKNRLFVCAGGLVLPIEPAEHTTDESKRVTGNRMIAYGEAMGKEEYRNGV